MFPDIGQGLLDDAIRRGSSLLGQQWLIDWSFDRAGDAAAPLEVFSIPLNCFH